LRARHILCQTGWYAFATHPLLDPRAAASRAPLWRGTDPAGRDRRRTEHPAKFLTVILSELSRAGLVATRRGRDGGYWLALPPIDIRYGDIFRLTNGALALVPCASRYAHQPCKNCVPEEECELRRIMLKVRDETAAILDRLTLADKFEDLGEDEPA
jgi:Rrf2 family protein